MKAYLKKHKKAIILSALLLLLAVLAVAFAAIFTTYGKYISHALSGELDQKKLSDAGIDKCDKLMIVAHPDDELLWGGAHLQEGGYFVLCLTNGDNPTRRAEFEKVKEAAAFCGLILSYPDKVAGKRSEWKYLKNSIAKDLSLILSSNDWKLIVTHNSEGEYGHVHHKMTSALVTKSCKELSMENLLWYFGKYYKSSELPSNLTPVDSNALKRKEELLTIYKSQKKTVGYFPHMNPYELWQPYTPDGL